MQYRPGALLSYRRFWFGLGLGSLPISIWILTLVGDVLLARPFPRSMVALACALSLEHASCSLWLTCSDPAVPYLKVFVSIPRSYALD